MAEKKIAKTLRISKDKNEKLTELRNYFNRSFDSVFEQLIENAYLRMGEDLNKNATEELKGASIKMAFQYQQLAFEIGKIKEENGSLKAENSNLKEVLERTNIELDEQSKRLNNLQTHLGQAIERDKSTQKALTKIENWIKAKDNTFVSKVKNLLE